VSFEASACHYCPAAATTRDHRVPRLRCVRLERFVQLGRGDERAYIAARERNIAPSCGDCNNRKDNKRARCDCGDCTASWELLAPPWWRWQWWDGPYTARRRTTEPMTQTIAEAVPALSWVDRWGTSEPRKVDLT